MMNVSIEEYKRNIKLAQQRYRKGVAGTIGAVGIGLGNPLAGITSAAGTYLGGRASQIGGQKLVDFAERARMLPDEYSAPLMDALTNGGGEKAFGALIFTLNQRDPEFREAYMKAGRIDNN